jgi:hypothetical protein
MAGIAALGACFGCAVLIRQNTFPLWLGFCAVIFTENLVKRRFALLGKYALGFCLGLAAVFIPAFLYLRLNGIWDDFLDQVVRGGALKGFSGGGVKQIAKNFYIVINRHYSFVPLLFGIFSIITGRGKNSGKTGGENGKGGGRGGERSGGAFYAGYTLSYILMVLFLSFSSGDSHYNMVLVPFFIPPFTIFAGAVYSAFSGIRGQKAVFAFFLCVVFSEGLVKYADDFLEIFHNRSGADLVRAGRMIDENTKPGDTIISLGFNGYIYPFTRRAAASKYIYQGSGVDYFPESREEFLSDVLRNRPAVIVIFGAEEGRADYLPGWYAPVYGLIEKDYKLLSDANGCYLYALY